MKIGNHWNCMGDSVEELVAKFIPLVCAKGKLEESVTCKACWREDEEETEESIHSLVYPATPLGCMAIVVSNIHRKTKEFFTAYPYSAQGGQRRLRIEEIKDWGNNVEGELLCVTADSDSLIGFFDTRYFANREHYKVGGEYDFRTTGLIYGAECTNEKTIEISEQKVLEQRYSARGEEPERRPDGTIPPDIVHYAGMTGFAPTDKSTDDAEFYCVIGSVSRFDLEGIPIYRIVPKLEDESHREVPLPRVIFGAASRFADGYVPKAGDSIGGFMWVQGFLDETFGKTSGAKAPK